MGHAVDVLLVLAQQSTSAAEDSWRIWVPVASSIIAALALLVALANRRIAKAALALSKQQEERRVARLDLSLVDAGWWPSPRDSARWIGFEILAVNPTDRDGTLVSIDLHVSYSVDGEVFMAKVPADSNGRDAPRGVATLAAPTAISANGAMQGWCLFHLQDALVGSGRIERFDLVARDSRGPTETVQAWTLREMANGEAEEATPE